MDVLLPPWIRVAEIDWRLVDFSARNLSPMSGAVQTVSRGHRLSCMLRFGNLTGAQRHALVGFSARIRGASNRALIIAQTTRRRRGAWPGGELFSNPAFAQGSAGWSWYAQDYDVAVSERTYRATGRGSSNFGAGGVGGISLPAYQGPIDTLPHVPYVTRCVASSDGAASLSVYGQGGAAVALPLAGGYAAQPFVRGAAEAAASTGLNSAVGPAGHTVDVHWMSCARCALVDGGGNLVARSDELDAWWRDGLARVEINAAAAPDGSPTAEVLVENSSFGVHQIHAAAARPNAVADVCAFARVRGVAGGRNAALYVSDDVASGGSAILDLATGEIVQTTLFGLATDVRAACVPLGLGWHYLAVIARLPAGANVRTLVRLVSGISDNYVGDGASSIAVWRAGAQVSSVATRGAQTTMTAAAPAAQAGTKIFLKGLPPSASGLVVPGDAVEIGGELKLVTAPLDSDAAGLGTLQIEPAMRRAALDGAAVIFHDPVFRGVLAEDAQWVTRPGLLSNATLSFVEAQ